MSIAGPETRVSPDFETPVEDFSGPSPCRKTSQLLEEHRSVSFDKVVNNNMDGLVSPRPTEIEASRSSVARMSVDLQRAMQARRESMKNPDVPEPQSFNPLFKLQHTQLGISIHRQIDERPWQTVMATGAVISLFAVGAKNILQDKDFDTAVLIVMAIIFAIFVFDFLLNLIFRPFFFKSFSMVIDGISTASFIVEFMYATNKDSNLNSNRNIAIRFIRLIRISHLLRVLFSSSTITSAVKHHSFKRLSLSMIQTLGSSHGHKFKPDQMEIPSNTWLTVSERMMRKLVLGMIIILICVMMLNTYETDRSAEAWLANFDSVETYSFGFNSTLVKFHLFNQQYDHDLLHLGMKDVCEVAWSPFNETLEDYLVRKDSVCRSSFSGQPYKMVEGPYGSRYSEMEVKAKYDDFLLQYHYADSNRSFAIFNIHERVKEQAIMDVMVTFVVMILLVAWFFSISADARDNLVTPIENLVKLIKELSQDPLGFVATVPTFEHEDELMELKMVEAAFVKISNITKVALGEAGMEILSATLKPGASKFDPILPGRMVKACFGFCDIRNFTDATECLQEKVLPFVNACGAVVHQAVVDNDGAPNKNIGDAFLVVFKHKLKQHKKEHSHVDMDQDPSSHSKRSASAINEPSCADNGLAAFLRIMDELPATTDLYQYEADPVLQARLPGFRVKLGYGLHVGWGVEGAIGSIHKIDPSYLSPHVNMSSRLESATKFFGVPLLMSQTVIDHLVMPYHQRGVRKLDKITVKGSNEPIVLYTFDRNVEAAGCKLSQEKYKQLFESGVDAYLEGKWPQALDIMRECKDSWPSDQPAQCLLTFMESLGNKCPEDWPGYREFTEK